VEPKDRIIQAAAEMFLEEGIKSVRMDDIATRLGVSKRTLYEMFGDKRDLLEQSLTYYFEQKRSEMFERTRETKNVFEEIFIMMGAMKKGDHHNVLVGNLKKFYPEIYRRLHDEANCFSYREFNRLLDRGIDQGLFLPDMDKELALITLTYTMTALFERKHHFMPAQNGSRSEGRPPVRDNISIEMAFEYVIVNFFRGLATHKGIEIIDELVTNYRQRTGQTNE
jgi:AcrR family transcriptional regulator